MISFDELKPKYIDELVKISEMGGLSNISRQTFEKELANKISHYTVAVEDDLPVGFIGIWNIVGEGEIIDIAVAVNFRRQGIGSLLIENIIKYCKENAVSVLHLEVRENNFSAISLYEKMNFVRVGMREKYYSDGENAVLMSLDLSS